MTIAVEPVTIPAMEDVPQARVHVRMDPVLLEDSVPLVAADKLNALTVHVSRPVMKAVLILVLVIMIVLLT
jgi:hypothetical protein